MSEVKVNKISPRTACGTVTLGDSGDTFTIPSGATITNSGTASGFGATGETSWDTTVKTTGTFTATAGVGYFLNTTGGIITVNLAAGTAGDSVALADYAGTWQTNNVTVSPNGSEFIGGVNADVGLATEGQSVTFVYIDGTQGWVNVLDSTSNVRGNAFVVATGGCITTCGDYKMHKFISPGTFCVSSIGLAPNNQVDYLVAAGGAGGGFCRGGGGGAGGTRFWANPVSSPTPGAPGVPLNGHPSGTGITVTASPYPIVVGGGGGGALSTPVAGTSGADSSFSSITSTGGGGGSSDTFGASNPAVAGGSGGGGANAGDGGAGNTPPVSPAQGTAGGNSLGGSGAAGGGGSLVAAVNGPSPSQGSPGGAGLGLGNSIFGTTGVVCGSYRYYGGGGGGGGGPVSSDTPGGLGGGGGGKGSPGGVGDNATINTGGGGGGASESSAGGNGGSGIVVIKYKYQ